MPGEHPVTPGLRFNAVALVLAAALSGSRVPEQIAPEEIVPILRRGMEKCGGPEGLQRIDDRNRAINVAIVDGLTLNSEQIREKKEIWSGGRGREQALVNLAFRVVNTPHDWRATSSVSDPLDAA